MTTERAVRSAASGPPIDDRLVAFEDLTARPRLREAALEHVARDGYARATIRAIAQTAAVSPGLLRRHYGSTDALREACDHYVFEMLHLANARLLADPGETAQNQMNVRLLCVSAVPGLTSRN